MSGRAALAGLATVFALALAVAPAAAQRDGVSDALAGHAAEMRQLTDPDPLRRAFFYDPVEVEGPNPGVPCDHLARRRPEAIAGTGRVVLLESVAAPRRRLRYWLPPDLSQDVDPIERATSFARAQNFDEFRVIGVRQFGWCR